MRTRRASARDVAVDAQSILEAQRLELEVVLHDLELLLEGDEFVLAGRQRVAQRICQASDGTLGAHGIVGDQGTHRVERIEQEVRVELGFQQAQFRKLQRP